MNMKIYKEAYNRDLRAWWNKFDYDLRCMQEDEAAATAHDVFVEISQLMKTSVRQATSYVLNNMI